MASLEKVKPGQPYSPSSKAHNAFVDAAEYVQRLRSSTTVAPQRDNWQATILQVKNTTGYDRDRFDVLGIDSVFPLPAANLNAFKNGPVLHGVLPAAGTHEGNFVVLLEPLANGKIGAACVAGVCIARIIVNDIDENERLYAEINPGDHGALRTSTGGYGSARVLWREAAAGTRWAVVHLGQPADETVPFQIVESSYTGSVPRYGVFPSLFIYPYTTPTVPQPRPSRALVRIAYQPNEIGRYRFFGVNVGEEVLGRQHANNPDLKYYYGRCSPAVHTPVWALIDGSLLLSAGCCGLLPNPTPPNYHSYKLGPHLPGFWFLNGYGDGGWVMRDLFTKEWYCKATSNWTSAGISYVDANPCNEAGTQVYNGSGSWPLIAIRVALPRHGTGRDPNIRVGNIFRYAISSSYRQLGGTGSGLEATGSYLDDKIGSIKLWKFADGIPQGWQQCGVLDDWLYIERFQ